jgi:iron complex outermembrane receptor protein
MLSRPRRAACMKKRYCPLITAAIWIAAASAAQAQPAAPLPERVEIIGTTPVPGVDVAKDQIPANAQTLSEAELRRRQSLNLPDALNAGLASVNVNEVQGNPFQMDVNFRGFAASPLLGTPQGLSVYFDGVRVNEPFGDVVNWDLLPHAAIAGITLLPGSNPVFGLNTLGGALTVQTKSGLTHAGSELSLEGGSFGRRQVEASHGQRIGAASHLFVAASAFDEDGWRAYSPSRVRQLYAKAGTRIGALDVSLGLTHADNNLIGNGLLPQTLLDADRRHIYTRPDQTRTRMSMLALNAAYDVSASHRVSATAYLRRSRSATLNGDLNDEYDPPTVSEAGVENRTHTTQRASGIAVQSTHLWGAHRLTFGVSHDNARSAFQQTEAEGDLDATRAVEPEEEPELNAWIDGHTRTTSVYAQALFALRPDLQLTLSGRGNDTRVRTIDQGRLQLGLPTTLDAADRYRKFNPAVGLTWQARSDLTLYASAGQGNRAPSPIELGCSDPDNPCVLPNALQSDPPLRQVVARTLEIGARGQLMGSLRWNATAFRTVNTDDLLFISNGRAAGYFQNFGRTQRQGIELSLARKTGAFDWSLAYSLLDATYRSSACIVAEANSSAETSSACGGDDEIEIQPGDRIPGLSRHSLKLSADWQPNAAWRVGAALRAYSGQFVRGNENNQHASDGIDYFGPGRLPGYAVVDFTASWRPANRIEVFGRIANVFDRRYVSAGALGENAFAADGRLLAPAEWRNETFFGPGAPRAGWIGVRFSFDG